MAAAGAVPLSLTTEALFYGRAAPEKGSHAVPAEAFFSRMDAIRITAVLVDAVAIARVANNFRGEAATWWTGFAMTRISEFDIPRLTTEWEYFATIFKRHWFAIRDYRDTVSDISELKQRQVETTPDFAIRLSAELHPLDVLSSDYTRGILHAMDAHTAVPAAFLHHVMDPAANPMADAADRVAHLSAVVQAARQEGADLRSLHGHFDHVARTLARNARDDKMRNFLRRKIFDVNRRFPDLLEMVRKEERAYRALPTPSTKLSAIHGEETAAASSGEDSDDDEDGEDVDAIRKGGKFIKGKKGKGGKKPFDKKKPIPAPQTSSKKCCYCIVDTHEIKDCRKFRKFLNLPVDGQLTVIGGAPKPPRQQGGGRPRRPFNEPMDTSAAAMSGQPPPMVHQLPQSQQQQEQVQQHHYYSPPQFQPQQTAYYYPPPQPTSTVLPAEWLANGMQSGNE